MSISKSKMWLAGGAVVCVLLVVASWMLLIQPKRAEASDTRDLTVATQQQNAQLRTKIEQLKAQFATLPEKQRKLEKIRQAMPADVAESTLVREVQNLSKGSGSTLVSVTSGEVASFAPTGPTTPTASPSASATASPSASATAPTAASGLVLAMPVTIQVDSTFAGSQTFLQKLQDKMPRALLVTDLKLEPRKPGDNSNGKPLAVNGDVELTVKGLVFILNVDESGHPTTATATGSTGAAN